MSGKDCGCGGNKRPHVRGNDNNRVSPVEDRKPSGTYNGGDRPRGPYRTSAAQQKPVSERQVHRVESKVTYYEPNGKKVQGSKDSGRKDRYYEDDDYDNGKDDRDKNHGKKNGCGDCGKKNNDCGCDKPKHGDGGKKNGCGGCGKKNNDCGCDKKPKHCDDDWSDDEDWDYGLPDSNGNGNGCGGNCGNNGCGQCCFYPLPGPKGDKGDKGDPGTPGTNAISAFAQTTGPSTQSVAGQANLNLGALGPSSNGNFVLNPLDNTLRVNVAGTYQVSAHYGPVSSPQSGGTFVLVRNGVAVPFTSADLTAGQSGSFSRLVTLAVGDLLAIKNNNGVGTQNVDLNTGGTVDSTSVQLSLLRVGA